MNKTFQINLGGIAFAIDDDAYRRLDLYMHELEEHFAHSDSRDEIIADIEARLAELLTEQLRGREIVSLHDIANAIKIMGSPSDFEDEPVTNQSERRSSGRGYESREKAAWDIKTGKRLFRDPDNKVIGGVCSGLAAYFGVEDPLWMRVAFVILFFTFGVGPLAYIIAWIMIPEAKTASDRLAMMGHPANVRNIADMVEKGLDDLSDSLKDNWEGFKKKSNHMDRQYMRRSDPFGTDVLVMDRPSLPSRVINTVRRKVDYFLDDIDDAMRF